MVTSLDFDTHFIITISFKLPGRNRLQTNRLAYSYEFLGWKYCYGYFSNSIPQGLIYAPWWPFQQPVQSEIKHTPQKWAIELMPIYRRFDLILLVVLLKLDEVI